MKITSLFKILVLFNLLSVGLLTASTGNFWWLMGLFINLFFLSKKKWARYLLIIVLNLGLLTILVTLGYYLSGIQEAQNTTYKTGSLAIAGLYLAYSVFVFSSKAAKTLYIKKKLASDPYSTDSWTCPKCSSEMVFSITCWNCGFKKEDSPKDDSKGNE